MNRFKEIGGSSGANGAANGCNMVRCRWRLIEHVGPCQN